MGVTPPPVTACCFYSLLQPTDSASQSRMDVDVDEAPFELTELDLAAATDTRAHAPALYDDADDDLLGIHDPDLLDIPPPMMYEAWSDDGVGHGTE